MYARAAPADSMQPSAGRRLKVKDLCVVLVFVGAVFTYLTTHAATQSKITLREQERRDFQARAAADQRQAADCDRKAKEAAARVTREQAPLIAQLQDQQHQAINALKESKRAGERLSRELDGVQAQLDAVREDHDSDGRKHADRSQAHETALEEAKVAAETSLAACRSDLEHLRRSSHTVEDELRQAAAERDAAKAERDAEKRTSGDLRKALDDALATLEEKRAVIDAAARLAELSLGAAPPVPRRKALDVRPLEAIVAAKRSDLDALAKDVEVLSGKSAKEGWAHAEHDLAALLEGVDGGTARR